VGVVAEQALEDGGEYDSGWIPLWTGILKLNCRLYVNPCHSYQAVCDQAEGAMTFHSFTVPCLCGTCFLGPEDLLPGA